jgi:hypothetical protein
MGYYTGDPGFMSFLGRAAGFIPGVGGILSKAIGGLSKFGAKHPTLSAAAESGIAGGTAAVATGVVGSMTTRAMGMHMRPQQGPGGMAMIPHPALTGAISPRGYHMSKPRKCGGIIIPSHPVRNRRMRVTNPRALRRAIRRAKGFERIARKVMHFVSPRKTRGRAVFRGRRKR